MIRTTSWLLAGVLGVGGLLLAAQPAQAQYRGGRGGGVSINFGGVGGVGRGGGIGIGIGGYGRPYGGFGGYPGGFGYGRPYGGYGFGGYPYGGYGYGRNSAAFWTSFGLNALAATRAGSGAYGYGGYYAAPNVYSYAPNYYSGNNYLAPSPDYGAAAPAYDYTPPAYAAPAQPAPAEAVAENRARVHVVVPDPEAQVWFDGRKTTSAGPTREFVTPNLDPGQDYHYTVTAAWNENGRVVTQERQVNVRAGSDAIVDFTRSGGDVGGAAEESDRGIRGGDRPDTGIRGGIGGPTGERPVNDRR